MKKRFIYNIPKNLNFVFEQIKTYSNLISCNDINYSGIQRVRISPIASFLLDFNSNGYLCVGHDFKEFLSYNEKQNEKYIIASGVAHSPMDWCGKDCKDNIITNYQDRKNLFYYLNAKYIEDLQKGIAFLLLDQTHEGYHAEFLFKWFHNSCNYFNINPKQIIYITGDLDVEKKYEDWSVENNISEKMLVIGCALFESLIQFSADDRAYREKRPLKSIEEVIAYKIKNIQKIKVADILQKRARGHRIWLFHEIVKNGLINDCIVSMNKIENYNHGYYAGKSISLEEYNYLDKILPILPPTEKTQEYNKELSDFSSQDSGKYITQLNDHIAINTLISVVSESSFDEDACFLSEKTFKPIAIGQPFIIFGNKNSLKRLQEMGYRTFHPFINEDYDTLDTWDRIEHIVTELKKIQQMTDYEKIEWCNSIVPILTHNKTVLENNVKNPNRRFKRLLYHYVRKI
jgi:hypothetical protein